MKEFCLSYEAITSLHEAAALNISIHKGGETPGKDSINDWLEGHHSVGRDIAQRVVKMLEDNNEGLVLSRHMLRYLQSVGIEEYKGMIAYSNWLERNADINESQDETEKDWLDACDYINNIISLNSEEPINPSVEAYLNECNTNSELIVKRKAYWLYMAYPLQSSVKNYEIAKRYVEEFYDPQIILPAIKGDSGYRKIIKNLMLSNTEIVNMVEFNIFRIKRIE